MENVFKSPIMKAREVLRENDLEHIPVDVNKLCQLKNIQISYVDFSELEQEIGKTISGAIQKQLDDRCIILVNEKDIEVRSRFTIAHELGHFFLHMGDHVGQVITSFRMDRSPREREADRFAAELLMPESLVRAEYENMVIPVSDSLAKIFNVSKQAMRIRLDDLELMYV